MTKNAWIALVLIVISLVIFTHSCSSDRNLEAPTQVRSAAILKHIKELSDDKYLGRMPMGPADQMTVDYIVDYCKAIGLQPANGDSYTQSVQLVETESTIDQSLTITSGAGAEVYQPGQDFVINSVKLKEEITVKDAELVFCGYGISDSKLGWDDFDGIDMKGKIAVVLVNDPGFGGEDSTFFNGNAMTYFGRWTYKYEEADRQGAAGVLIIHETSSAGYPWFVVSSSWSGPQLSIEKESTQNGADIKGWMHLDMAKDVFRRADQDLSALIKAARKPGFKPVSLGSTLSVGVKNTYKRDESDNVIAMIEGSTQPDEYILFSAHWDHLGVGKAVSGDSIYNGALDNASGMGQILAIAEGLKAQSAAPDRSILFVMVTAEEQGLLGSEYYALHPVVPHSQVVANINLDGCNPNGATQDFQIIGYGHSDMDDIAAEELAKQDRYVLPDQEPEKGYFFRSDHFNFAKVGIPALFGEGGYDNIEHGIDYGRQKKAEYISEHYHAPSDEYDEEAWDMSGVMQDAQLYYNIGWRLANSNEWPRWSEKSEFSRPRSSIRD